MKILLCSPYKGKTGGISMWTKHIMKYSLHSVDGVDLDVVDMSRSQMITPNMTMGKRIYLGVKDFSTIIKNIKKNILISNPEVIHIVSSGSISLLKDIRIATFAKKHKVKTIVHFHFGRIPEIFTKNNWEAILLKQLLKQLDKIIVIDKQSLLTLKKLGYSNVYYVPNPISPEVIEFVNGAKKNNIETIDKKIVFAGHVIASKGIFELVEAVKQIDDAELFILGANDHITQKRLTNIIGDNSVKIHILGEQSHESIINEMCSADIFCLPSYTEGFPNVILESMAAGCTIVSTNVGAIPEMLNVNSDNSACGICVEPKNIDQLRKALEYSINNKVESEQFKINAMNRVSEMYSIAKIWKQLINIWVN